METSYRKSIEAGHDVIYDYCCTTCDGENLNAEARYYCKDCSQLVCEPCRKYHDKFFKEHRVLERKDVAKWGDVKPVTSSLMCDEHPGKELEMFCEDHDRLCCHTCISVKHRVCKQVKPVSQMANGIQKSSRFKSFLTEAVKTQSRLKHVYDKQENSIELLIKAREEITCILKEMKKHFNQIVDRLVDESTQEMDKLLTMLKEKVASDKDICSDFYDKIQRFLDGIQNLGKQCDELAFQGYKKCCEQVASAEEMLSSMQNVDYNLEFTPDAKINQYLSSLETLGTFHGTPTDLIDSLKTNEVTKPLTAPDHIFSSVDKKTYNVTTSGDTGTCDITGMCQLPNGQTAIVDHTNNNVRLLSAATYFVVDKLKLPSKPQDICHTSGTELAVTVYDFGRQEIRIIDAGNGKLSHVRTVELDHCCEGIAYHNDQLYVSSGTALYAYNMSGEKIIKLYEGTYVYRFSLSDDGSRIYVTNYSKHLLLTLDSSGNQLSTLSDSELQRPTDVCVADNGSVFVCGLKVHTVVQVDREGKRKMATLATQADGVYKPRSLCFDRRTNTLLVGQEINENLLALQLK